MKIGPESSRRPGDKTAVQRSLTFKFTSLFRSQKRQKQTANLFRRKYLTDSRRKRSIYAQRNRRPSHKDNVGSVLLGSQRKQHIKRGLFISLQSRLGAIQLIDKPRQITLVY
jgi:hypothetical protein